MTRYRKEFKVDAPERGYFRIVVLSDLHLPGNILREKKQALTMINSWPDVDLVAVTGDIIAIGGDREQKLERFRTTWGLQEIVVKTFDHKRKAWLSELERVIIPGER